MSYTPWTDAEIEAYAKAHTGEVEVAYEAGPAKNRQSLFFHGILSRPNNTWVATRRDKTINLQAADIDVYNLTPYVRGQSEPAASRDDVVEASKKASRGEDARPRVKNPTATGTTARAPPALTTAVDDDSDEEREVRRNADRARKINERRRADDDHRTADERHRAMDRRQADMDDLQRQGMRSTPTEPRSRVSAAQMPQRSATRPRIKPQQQLAEAGRSATMSPSRTCSHAQKLRGR